MAGAAVFAALLPCGALPAHAGDGAPRVEPTAADGSRGAMQAFLRGATGREGYPGVVALAWRDGRTTFHGAFGHADLARTRPLREDAIFRLYSMTKPIASVAVLALVEDGRIALDAPLSRYLPGFALPRVVVGGTVDAPLTKAAPSAPTIRQLLSHTSGIAADGEQHPLALALLARARVEDAADLADVAHRLSTVPLAEAPGKHFHYEGANTELLARVVEVASGQRFSDFVARRITGPLRMRETAFEVPPARRARVVDLVTTGEDGRLRLADTPSARMPGARLCRYDSAAGGLYSTAGDYLRFARMLLGDGALGRVRVLSPDSVALLRTDVLGARPGPAPGEGFGLGAGVLVDPAARDRRGPPGQFGWPGAASTWFTVDPAQRRIAILLAQYLPEGPAHARLPRLATHFQQLVYEATP